MKLLTFGKKATGGRNRGRIATKRRGTLISKNFRFVDFKRNSYTKENLFIQKQRIYDPNRTAKLSIIAFNNGFFTYILQSEYANNQKYVQNDNLPLNAKDNGFSVKLDEIPLGSIIHNIELFAGMGGKFIRAAGTSAIVLKKIGNKVLVKLKSGEHRYFAKNAFACLGSIGNHEHFLKQYNKAGTIRLLNRRPRVRPSVTNPVDHPMGGRTKGGCAPKSKTGKLSHGPSTAKKKKHNLVTLTARKSRLK